MAWKVSPSSAASGSSAALNGTSVHSSYKTQKGWELTKNMSYIGPANQLYQRSIDLEGYLAADGFTASDHHPRRNFYGYKIDTAADTPKVAISASDPGTVSKTIKKFSNKNFTRTESGSSSHTYWAYTYSKPSALNASGSVSSLGLHTIYSSAPGSGTITVRCYGPTGGTCDQGYSIWVNGSYKANADADTSTTISASFNAGDKVEIKASHYNSRSSYDSSGTSGYTWNSRAYCRFTIEGSSSQNITVYFNEYRNTNTEWKTYSGIGTHFAMLSFIGIGTCSFDYEDYGPNDYEDYGPNDYEDSIIAFYVDGVLDSYYNTNGGKGNKTRAYTSTFVTTTSVVSVSTYNHTPARNLADELQNIESYYAQISAELKCGVRSAYSHQNNSLYAYNTLSSDPSSARTFSATASASNIYSRETLTDPMTVNRQTYKNINRYPGSAAPKAKNYSGSNIFGTYEGVGAGTHYDSFYFVAAEAGTVSGTVRGGVGQNYTSWNTYDTIDGHWDVYVNGVDKYEYDSDQEETFSFSVNEGDVVSFKLRDNSSSSFTPNDRSYVTCNFSGEIAKDYYVPVTSTGTEWLENRTSMPSEVVSACGPDFVFACKTDGTLSGSYTDIRAGTNQVSNNPDSYLKIFRNGVAIGGYDDNDLTFSISCVVGDVIVIRPCPFEDRNDGYVATDYSAKTSLPSIRLSYSYSGSTFCPYSQTHKLSWTQFISCIIKEAALWVSREALTNYAFPLYIDDSTGNQTRLDAITNMLAATKLYLDLFAYSKGTVNVPENTRFLVLADKWNNGQRFTSSNLEEIDYQIVEGTNLRKLGYGLPNLKKAYINTSHTISKNDDITQAFAECPKLEYGWALTGNSNATELFLNSPIKKVYLYGMGGSQFTKACYNNQSLTTIEEYLHTAKGYSFNQAFENCVNLQGTVKLSGEWGDGTRAFYNCYNVSTFDYSGLTGLLVDSYMFYNCYKSNLVKSHDTIKTFLSKFNLYDEWVNGTNRSAFFNCPYNGTILEDIMSYDEQASYNFQPEHLMYKALRANINSNDPGYKNINHIDTPWSTYVSDYITYAKPHTITAVSHQINESSAAAYLEVDGKIVFTYGNRGHCVGVFDCKTMSVKHYNWTDTYGYEINTTSMETVWQQALSVATPTDIIFVLSFDATARDATARQHSLDIGGSTGYGTWGSARLADAQLGKLGLGAGKGYEMITDTTYASVTAKFTTDGLVCDTWMDSAENYIFEPSNKFTYEHPREYHYLEVPAEEYWRWKYLYKNLKSLWDSCSFTYGEKNKANFTLSIETTGANAEINPNSELSFNSMTKKYDSPDFIYHLGKVENVSDDDISLYKMFSGIPRIHCVECDFINIDDISYAFYQCEYLEHVIAKMNGCTKAQYTFAECPDMVTIDAASSTITDSQYMCYNSPKLEEYDLVKMTTLKDATSMFELCPSLKTEQFKQNTKLPECLEISRRMFKSCSITEIEGNWVPRNSSSSFQNATKVVAGQGLVNDWENMTLKDGWSFPSKLYDAQEMFANNPITKITYLRLHNKADNSWLFKDCPLVEFKWSWLDVDTYNDTYTGIFDGCQLSEENRIWLPIDVSSDFDLQLTSLFDGNNQKPIEFWVDDQWCQVNHSGFIEYQHIRRPLYEKAFEKDEILIKFWSHPHIHSAEMRGYNELHDTKIFYDPTSIGHTPGYETSWEGDHTRKE